MIRLQSFLPDRAATFSELREDYDTAEEQYRFWTSEGACQPGSNKWEEVTAKYQAARDAYDFGLRCAEVSESRKDGNRAVRKGPEKFETPFSIFTVHGVLGEGGTGTVYEARDDDEVSWAIKCLKPTALTRQRLKRFKNELAFCSKSIHPNIIQVADSGLVDVSGNRVPFYVMPQFPSTLRQLMRAGIDHSKVLHLFEQLMAGLEAAHTLGVWHRDLKPENLLYDSAKDLLVICDFGIAHFADPLLQTAVETAQHDRLANFQYAAPEQRVLGTTDHRADIYALGLILNEMFTNQLLQGSGHKQIGDVAPEYAYLDALVDRMVRQSPAERPASIAKIRAALPPEAFLDITRGKRAAITQLRQAPLGAAPPLPNRVEVADDARSRTDHPTEAPPKGGGVHPDLLVEKRLAAGEGLWSAVLDLKEIFSAPVLFFTVLLPSEYDSVFDEHGRTQDLFASITDDLFVESTRRTSQVEKGRPYLREKLWAQYFAYRAFLGRLAVLITMGKRRHHIDDWREDSGVHQILASTFSQQELESLVKGATNPNAIHFVLGKLEALMLDELRRIASDDNR